MFLFDPRRHFWIVAGDESRVWSSADAAYISSDSPDLQHWLARSECLPTRIVSEQELTEVLGQYGLPGPILVEPPVPPISKAQCLLWLYQLGKTEADIDAFIETLPEDEREPARIEWRHRPIFRHDNPLILAAADEFGIPRSYLPDAFRAAAAL